MELFKDEKTKKVIEKIRGYIKESIFDGHVYAVGGCVRDSILGLPVKDIDLVVDIENGGTMLAKFLATKDFSFKPDSNPVIFEKYGTANVRFYNDPECSDIEIECVQTRKEQYHSGSRNPETCFGTIEEDAKRRDLTINALYYSITEQKVYDYNGTGMYDMVNKLIKTPSDPDIIFSDDPLRMLRVIRFSTKLEWGIEKDTWLGIIKNIKRIDIISQERITDELSKILCSKIPSVGIKKLLYSGLLQKLIPDVYSTLSAYESRNPAVTVFDHTMEVLDSVEPYIEHRLAALFHDVGRIVTNVDRTISPNQFSAEVAESDLKEMKFPKDVINAVAIAIRHHEWFTTYTEGFLPPDKKIRKFVNSCGEDLPVALDLMHANNTHKTYNKKKTQVLQILKRIEELDEVEKLVNVKPPVNGNDLKERFNLKKGPIIGTLLEAIKNAYIENPDITKEECFEIAEAKIKTLA